MSDEPTIWEQDEPDGPSEDKALVVDVDGFEGPLDLLLALARTQKVDLSKISILQLAEQYLSFIDRVKEMRLELAADYLVMAAWLAFLKSKLLLPEPETEEEATGEELANLLQFRLKRLEAMRKASASLMNRNRLGREVFARGAPEAVEVVKKQEFSATLYDLLTAYALQRQRQSVSLVQVKKRTVWSLQEAREALQRLVGMTSQWQTLDDYLLDYLVEPEQRKTVKASSFTASLELAREGILEIRQSEAYAPLYLRSAPEKDEKNVGQ